MLIGPDNFTRPPASQRQRWDAQAPLERMPHVEKYSRPVLAVIYGGIALVLIVIWAMVFAAVLS